MLNNLKALLIVLSIAIIVFMMAKPLCLRFMTEQDFTHRRNVWIGLTITAFASPSFWLYAIIAMPVLFWSAQKDQNPLALYVLVLFVIPPIGLQLPTIGIKQLFELDNFRILSFTLLITAAWRLRERGHAGNLPSFKAIDRLMLAYVVMQLVLLMPYESITNTMRRGFLLTIDMLLIYFVASRSAASRNSLVEVMASFCLMSAILAPIALFESLKGWLLYVGLGDQWGYNMLFAYLLRGESLRAQASTGHSLALGGIIAIAFGFWLYLASKIRSNFQKIVVAAWILIGLLAAHSRAPAFAIAIMFSINLALGPKGYARLFSALIASSLIAVVLAMTPAGNDFIQSLPIAGNVTDQNVDYRIRLAEVSWELIQQNPIFGNPFFLTQMEELRQGQGIIDLLNQYANVALLYGITGLALFVAPLLLTLYVSHAQMRRSVAADLDLTLLGCSLMACFLANLALIASQGIGRGQVFYLLVGLVAGYAKIAISKTADSTQQTMDGNIRKAKTDSQKTANVTRT